MKMLRLIVPFICSAFAMQVLAQPGISKFDMNTGLAPSYPLHITLFDGKIACYANDGSKGWELFTTDGTATPLMAADLNPLAGSAISQSYRQPMAAIGNKLYFSADNGVNGTELFSYNGSSTPLMTPEIEPGTAGSSPDNFAVLNGQLFYRARTAAEGYELWQYNPSMNQNQRLTDINPGADSSLNGSVIAFNNKIYFSADSGSGNTELWVYDPFTSGSGMIDDINPGLAPSNPQNFVVIGNKLYFSADNATTGRELYEYTGTGLPQRITDVVAGSLNGMPETSLPVIAGYNNKIYFTATNADAENQLYVYDAGNATLAATTNDTNTSEPQWLTPYGGKLYFAAYNDTTSFELWAYDGSSNPTLVLDLCKGATGSNPQQLLAVGDDLYFRANDCSGVGEELLKYNYKKLSVQLATFNADIKLYPNPTRETATLQVNLQQPATMLAELTDMQGRVVYTTGVVQYGAGNHQIKLPVVGLPAGVYQCNMVSADGIRYYSSQLIVQ